MPPSPEQTSTLADLGEAALRAFKLISQYVARQLGEREVSADPQPLLAPKAQMNLRGILSENRQALRSLRREPAIARLEVEWLDTNEVEHLYICRASSASVEPDGLDGRVVSYRAALGRLAEVPAGSVGQIFLPRGRRKARVRCRLLLHPSLDGVDWDSLDNAFELLDRTVGVDSILRLLAHERQPGAAAIDFLSQIFADEETKQIFFDQRRRKTVDRMELRDQPVLDQFQGSIFRLPLDRQVVLLGPPGAGKTTTLIRRLAQKRTEEALTVDEQERLTRLSLKNEFMSDTGWVMFSPTELLKLYLREAFNRESVPASSWNLRTWNAERISLGRDVLRFLKGASSGRFTLADSDNLLLDCRSPALASLHDEVAKVVDDEVLAKCSQALEWMDGSSDRDAQQVAGQLHARFRTDPMSVDTIHSFAENNDTLRNALSRLSDQIDNQERTIANDLLAPDPTARLKALHELLKDTPTPPRDGDEDDDGEIEEEVIEPAGAAWDRASTARTLLRLVRSLAEQATSDRTRPLRNDLIKVMNWIGRRRLAQDQLLALGRKLLVRWKVRVLDGAARDLVGAVPAIYARFRRRSASRGVYYRKDAEASSFSSVLSPLETDVVILAMLRNARRSLERLPDAAWLQSITGRYVMQLFVDEATDVSSVQLACMLELSHPKLRSWFACGDFRQRITKSGITSHDEIEWLGRVAQVQNLEVREITSEYRQSERLKALARALWDERDSSGITNHAETPADDPAPLLVESISGGLLARWLANRILEVERLVGRLPSIAVFVDSEHSIDEVVKSTAVFLAARNIQIVGCRDGRDVGNSQEVRVFDIQHIKGLEFEAVFFVGVDALAERMPDLFDRYIYVGVTRAATFLGITCRTRLPEKLESIRPLLSTGGWE